MPGYDWDEHFDGYYWKVIETATAVSPLSIVGELAPSNKAAMDRYKVEFMNADVLSLKAQGAKQADIDKVYEAHKKGEASFDTAVRELLENSDANSQEAIDATHEKATQIQDREVAEEQAAELGIIHKIVSKPNSDNVDVYDNNTGEVVVKDVHPQQASVLVSQSLETSDRNKQAFVDGLVSQIQGTKVLQEQSGVDAEIRPLDSLTELEASIEFEGSSERLVEQAKIREKLDGGNGNIAEIVLGVNIKAGKHGRANETLALFGNSDLFTAIHEQTHAVTDRLHASGEFTFSEQVESLKELDTAFDNLTYTKVENGERVTRPASDYRLLPADFDSLSPVEQNTARSEALSNLSEILILRTQKGGKTKFRDLLNKNLKAKASLGNGSVGKLKSYISAIRDWFGHNLVPAEILKRAEREGKLDSTKLDELQARLFDYTPQESYEDQVLDEAAKLDEEVSDNPFSVGKQLDADYLKAVEAGDTEAAQDLTDQAAKNSPYNTDVYHGTTHKFNEFKGAEIGNVEGHFGATNYFTSSESDASSNYLDDGADLQSRIERRAEQLEYELEGLDENDIDSLKEKHNLDDGIEQDFEEMSQAIAESELKGDDNAVLKLYADFGNVLTIDARNETGTFLEFQDEITEEQFNEVAQELIEEGEFEADEIEDYDYLIRERIEESNGDPEIYDKIYEALQDADIDDLNSAFGEVSEVIQDYLYGGVDAFTLDKALRERLPHLENSDGNLVSSDFIGLLFTAMGYDTIALENADAQFSSLDMEYGVTHYHTLNSNRLKLSDPVTRDDDGNVIPLSERFNEQSDDIRFQIGHNRVLDILQKNSFSNAKNPEAKVEASQKVRKGLEKLRREKDKVIQAFGKDVVQRAVVDPKTKTELREEAKTKEEEFFKKKSGRLSKSESLQKARAEAKEYAEAWLDKELKKQERDNNPRQRIIRALSIHDALALSLPSEVRGKIGGVTKLAKLGTNDSALKYLEEKFARAEKELERFLSKEADKNLKKLFKRAKATRQEAGKSDKGKIDPVTHRLFDKLKKATKLTDQQVEKKAESAQKEASKGEDRTADEVVLNKLLAELLPQFGNWKGRTSNEKTEALAIGWKVVRAAAHDAHQKEQARREYYASERKKVQDQVGVEVSSPSLQDVDIDDKKEGFKNIAAGFDIELSGLEVFLEKLLGTKSEMAREITERQRQAEMLKSQIRREDSEAVNMFFKDRATFNETGIKGALDKTTSKELKGMRRLSELLTPNIETTKGTYSELQIATMIMTWNQPDGRRHMEGIKDENGKVTSHWSYDQDFIDSVQEKLSGDTLEFMDFIYDRYEARRPQLNTVYKSMNDIDLPTVEGRYAPINNNPFMTNESEVDLTSGRPVTSGGFSPNPTKRRSSSAVAQPIFNDALTVFLQNSDAVSHYISHAEFARDFNSIFSQREVMNSIKVKFGEAGTNAVSNWNKLFIDGGVAAANTRGKFNRWLFRSTGRLAKMALALKPSVTLIQSTILGGGIFDMSMKSYLKRMAKLSTGQLDFRENWNSEFIQQRYKDQPVILQMMRDSDPSTAPSKMEYYVDQFAHIGISGADAFFTTATYSIYKDHYKEEGVDLGLEGAELEKYAETKAIKSTERVSQPSRIGTRSIMENTERSPWKILGYAFMSDARLKASITAHRVRTGEINEKARAIAFFWMINGVGASVIRSMWRDVRDDGEDDEIFDPENWDVKSMTISSLLGPMTAIPVAGEILSDSVSILAGEKTYDGTLIDGTKKGAKSLSNADDYLEGDVDVERALRDTEALLTTVGMFNDKAAAAKSITSLLRDVDKVLNNVEE